ncbi:PAS domain-containing protein [Rhizobium tubonense]|uniref:histidine kinase n=1 Tax=Rhizobium tubonense TaxID=484088 RepID=A0A2W4C6E9_9HYPH|nr:PAS domain-containing protein [Rhizobium tubonense]PZM08591.1 hypothetical protein CPY51_28335 [Rhizobium tubonense]
MDLDLGRILDSMPGMVLSATPEGEIGFVNREWSDFAGLGGSVSDGPAWQAIIGPNELPDLVKQWKLIIASGEPGLMKTRLRRFDGQDRPCKFRCSPMRDDQGEVLRGYVIASEAADQETDQRTERQILDGIPAGIGVLTSTGELKAVNDHVVSYFGKSEEELTRCVSAEIVHPEDLQHVLDTVERAVTNGEAYDVELRFLGADGNYRWFQVRGKPLRDGRGSVFQWYVLHLDIDERKRAEEALRTSETNLRDNLNALPTTAWSTWPDGYVDFLNARWLDYSGSTAEQAGGFGWGDVIHPDDAGRLFNYWQTCLATGKSVDIEARMRRYDGEYRWFLFRADPLRDENGTIIKWFGIETRLLRHDGVYRWFQIRGLPLQDDSGTGVRWYSLLTDIDDRKGAEEELRRSEAFLADAQRVSKTGSFAWRVGSTKVTWSDETYRIFGFDPAEPVTLDLIRSRLHPDNVVTFEKVVDAAQREGSDFDHETRMVMPDQSIKFVRVVAHNERNKDGELELRGAVRDVTASRLAEEALSKARSDLARVARVTRR